MPIIISSTKLRNEYTKISKLRHYTGEPVYTTINGEGDLVIMSIDAYELRERAFEIRAKLLEEKVRKGNDVPIPSLDESVGLSRNIEREKL